MNTRLHEVLKDLVKREAAATLNRIVDCLSPRGAPLLGPIAEGPGGPHREGRRRRGSGAACRGPA